MSPIPPLPATGGSRSPTRPDCRRLVFLWSIAAAAALVPVYFLAVADVSHVAWDYRAYYAAADAALHGESFVGVETGLPGVSSVSPPVAVALFVPQAAVGGWRVAFSVQTAVTVLAALGLAALTLRTIEVRRGRLDAVDQRPVGGD